MTVAPDRPHMAGNRISLQQTVVTEMNKRLDQSEGRVTALLSDKRPKGFWERMRGK